MTNQQLIDSGNLMMDKTDQAIGGHKRLFKTPSMLEQKLQLHSRISGLIEELVEEGKEEKAQYRECLNGKGRVFVNVKGRIGF
ncbi:hypothetical protein SO802_034363 [Lithocarpus litseifolius]|uniref:Uncharacterized protein n=1 Tax=Lithocarpus litseifolius TaxID=425828 RepID=A0AAW2BHD8_9ROSI